MTAFTEQIASILPHKDHLFVCFTGGGGKTSAIKALGSYFKAEGKSVLITTTTKFQNPLNYRWDADYTFTDSEEILSFTSRSRSRSKNSAITVVFGKYYSPEKLCSPDIKTLEKLKDSFDVILCEADGSRGLPFKVHSERDPVIPPFCDFTVSVLGAGGALKDVPDVTFGLENLKKSEKIPEKADESLLSLLLCDPQGILKGTKKGKRAVLVNQMDLTTTEQAYIFLITKWPSDCDIIYASVLENSIYYPTQDVKK
ncbi:MAG: putative selenium-dependent hydroxylase accessory protein YqeC [Sphaerochaetaceae bacterium]|nr:putative selenium-dependent hydroxylase accessory protein YqeC [Sphaerochaetaceae bacterium]